jgi:Spx/MgsR family transcriptional regulator
MKLYGLPNCDTTRAAMKWLKENKIDFEFHDFKKQGISISKLKAWLGQIPVEKLLNKQSTTWRGLTPGEQATSSSTQGAIDLMQKHTSLIKRPVIEWNNKTITAGYTIDVFKSLV